jgi:hypothetical protein
MKLLKFGTISEHTDGRLAFRGFTIEGGFHHLSEQQLARALITEVILILQQELRDLESAPATVINTNYLFVKNTRQ